MHNYYLYPRLTARNPPADLGNGGWNTRPPKRAPAKPSFFALQIHSNATRPIVPEDNTDLAAPLQSYRRPIGHRGRSATGVADARKASRRHSLSDPAIKIQMDRMWEAISAQSQILKALAEVRPAKPIPTPFVVQAAVAVQKRVQDDSMSLAASGTPEELEEPQLEEMEEDELQAPLPLSAELTVLLKRATTALEVLRPEDREPKCYIFDRPFLSKDLDAPCPPGLSA
ncbi:UNVERIFIED_CONTAM: hypothetical protein FKN15_041882 [Acipenser sinensis]